MEEIFFLSLIDNADIYKHTALFYRPKSLTFKSGLVQDKDEVFYLDDIVAKLRNESYEDAWAVLMDINKLLRPALYGNERSQKFKSANIVSNLSVFSLMTFTTIALCFFLSTAQSVL